MKLGMTLRLLSGARVWDLVGWFKWKKSTIMRIFFQTVAAVIGRIGLPGLPQSIHELHRSSWNFKCSRRISNPLNGCVGALDGIAIKIQRPRGEEDQRSYFNRKGFFAPPVQAVCDSTCRFLCLSMKCVGSTHDAVAHAVSKLGKFLDQDRLNGEFWLAGDEAYNCSEYLITPVPRSEANDDEDAFNFYLSQLRIHIEQAFGMLVSKWRILETPMSFSVRKCTRVVAAAMCLHNWCINERESLQCGLDPDVWKAVYTDTILWHRQMRQELIRLFYVLQGCGDDLKRSNVQRVRPRKREMLIAVIREKGLRRPALKPK